MKYLIDSDWLIDFLKGKIPAVKLFTSLDKSETLISIISYGEIYEGVIFATNRMRREEELLRLMTLVELAPLDKETMEVFAALRGTLERDGKKLTDFDLLIAATAIRSNLVLVTRNLRHFERIPGLKLFPHGQEPHS